MRARLLAFAACALLQACTELRSAPPDGGAAGGGGSGGSAGTGGRGGTGVAGTGGTGVAGAGGTGVAGAGGTGVAGAGGTGVAGAGGTGVAGAGGTGLPDGLIGWWRFNENTGTTTADSSGNVQNGVLVGGATWVAGHEGSGAVFNGTTSLVSVQPFNGSPLWNFPVVAVTFSAWIRPDAAAVARSSATAVARTHEDFAFQDFWLGLVDGVPRCTIHEPNGEGASAVGAVAADTWTHLTCTYDLSGAVLLYVDGNPAGGASANQILGPIPTRILIGAAEIDHVLGYFSGAIDDVRIYNRTLAPAEVKVIAQ